MTPQHNLNLSKGTLRADLLIWLGWRTPRKTVDNPSRDFSKIAELVADVRNETIADVFRSYDAIHCEGMLTASIVQEFVLTQGP